MEGKDTKEIYLTDEFVEELGLEIIGTYLCQCNEAVYKVIRATPDGVYVREVKHGIQVEKE